MLDLFCCQGGAGAGYASAGWTVTGIDNEPQKRYPFEFVQADALDYLFRHGEEFDAIHASPPCQAYSLATAEPERHSRLLEPVLVMLRSLGKPYVVENVEGARERFSHPLLLCGSSFGLGVRRHRLFETNMPLYSMPCAHGRNVPVGVYGDHADQRTYARTTGGSRGVKALTEAHASSALGGVDWMDWYGMTECIPPAYTQFLGEQLFELLGHGIP
jgi:DNA (cytosine-5)-methyltransferase 1